MSSRTPSRPERRPRRRRIAAALVVIGIAAPGSSAASGPAGGPRSLAVSGVTAAPLAGSTPAGGLSLASADTGLSPAVSDAGVAAPLPGLASSSAVAVAPLPVAAVLAGAERTTLVVDLDPSTRSGGRAVTVAHDGAALPAELTPVLSGDVGVTLVVDTSAAGAAALPAWLSAAARFVLEAPSGARAAVLGAGTPASVIARPQTGPAGIVRALQSVRPSGERDTADALRLATRQFPDAPAGRRVVVLYTTAPDAGGPDADTVATDLRAAGTILVVVGTATANSYWARAAAATGGFFAPAGDPVVRPALDQVAVTLGGRHLIRFPTPARLPAQVSVTVRTGELSLVGEATVPAPPGRSTSWAAWGIAAGVGSALLLLVLMVVLRRHRRALRPVAPVPVGPPVTSGLLRPLARGRATVPGMSRTPPQAQPAHSAAADHFPEPPPAAGAAAEAGNGSRGSAAVDSRVAEGNGSHLAGRGDSPAPDRSLPAGTVESVAPEPAHAPRAEDEQAR